jgi:hypothetical protein
MKYVERSIPSFRWADEIEISNNDGIVRFFGKKLFAGQKPAVKRDLFAEYLRNISSTQAGDEQNAPHYLFANAKSEPELLAFFERFGPVSIEPASLRIMPNKENTAVLIEASQSWESLRREHQIYLSLLTLYREVHSGQPNCETLHAAAVNLRNGCSFWVEQFKRETKTEQLDLRLSEDPRWIWNEARQIDIQGRVEAITSAILGSPDPIDATGLAVERSHVLLCTFLNAFPPTITRSERSTVEAVSDNLAFGIRHLLYFLIRKDYLAKARISTCAWDACARWFRVGTKGSPCCSPEHGERFRQWKYYHEGKGQKKRIKRYKKVEKPKRRAAAAKKRKGK